MPRPLLARPDLTDKLRNGTRVEIAKKKLYVVSLGCPKNLVDTEVMLGQLEQAGYETIDEPAAADVLLINTCGFIRPAVEEAIDEILALGRYKQEHPPKTLVVAGCLVQRYGAELRRELPEVDLFLGTDGFVNLAERLSRLAAGDSCFAIAAAPPRALMDSALPRKVSTPAHRAYLKITEGCDNRCSYCLIPSIRGPLRSRPIPDLVKESSRLAAAGVKELTLIAQDLTAYGRDLGPPTNLPALLTALLADSAIPWLRLLYLHPAHLSRELLTLMAANPRILPYLDIPLQHVSDRILKLMNRPYTRVHLEQLMTTIRQILPTAAIRTTFMVGFPGETAAEVAELEQFLKTHRLDHVGIFAYANEEGCAAAALPAHCADEVKEERRQAIMALQARLSLAKMQTYVGKVEQVLVEGISRETELLLEGRTRFQAPDIDGVVYITAGTARPGDLVAVNITEAHHYDLVGEIVEPAALVPASAG